ncbi:MAG: sulfatase-like hydrolase/transferase [Isosphaeraceae bacterium]
MSLVMLAIVGLALSDVGPSKPSPRPNVVFLYTDDQGLWTEGAYGNREAKTPNMDRIAREGALFRNAFTATPVCSPSRASMLTSRYPTQVGIADWINPQSEPDLGLAQSAILWPELLKSAGYATALVGKWHLGTRPEFHPKRQGFDHFYGFLGGGNKPINPTLEVNGVERDLEGSLPDLLVDEALAWLDAHHKAPFLLSVHFRAPHSPYAPVPEQDSALFRDLTPTIPDVPDLPRARVEKLTREYYGSIHSADRNIGRVLDRLDALGLAKNTYVIQTSDHGYMIGHHGLLHKGNATWIVKGKSGWRPNMFDHAIRVPLSIRGPGIKAGTTIDQVVSNLEVFPTVLDLVGLGSPPNLHLEGRSAAALLRGESPPWDDTLFGQYDMHHYKVAQMRMIRTREWKLINHHEPGAESELYHLADDPGETKNLFKDDAASKTRSQLSKQLTRWMQSIGDPLAPGGAIGD